MTDGLREMFDAQFEFFADVDPTLLRATHADRVRMTRDNVLHAQTELVELLNEVPGWKTWLQPSPRDPEIGALTEEAVDVVKHVLNVLLAWGVTADDFLDAFRRKSEVNVHRHLQHVRLARLSALARRGVASSRVAVLDIDGVLAAYPEHWLDYVAADGWSVNSAEFSLTSGVRGVPRERYVALKHAYRAAGLEAEAPPLPGAVDFTLALRAAGYAIVLVSARPVDRYKRLYSDTIRWLRAHGFAYDAVLWEPGNKEDRVIRDLPGAAFALEDDPLNVEKLQRAGVSVRLLDRPYNRAADVSLPRAMTYGDVLEDFGVVDPAKETVR